MPQLLWFCLKADYQWLLPLMEGRTVSLGKPAWSVNKAHHCTSNLLVAVKKAFSFPMKNKARP